MMQYQVGQGRTTATKPRMARIRPVIVRPRPSIIVAHVAIEWVFCDVAIEVAKSRNLVKG